MGCCRRIEQKNGDVSCVTGVAGTTGTTFNTQHTWFDLLEEFGHGVDKSQSNSKTKRTTVASGNLQDFMDAIIHQLIKWEDLEHCHTNHDFGEILELTWASMQKNKIMVKFPQGKKTGSKKGVIVTP